MAISTADKIMNKVSSMNSTDDNDAAVARNRATIAGAVAGVFAGMYYGYTRKKNIFILAAIGAVAGAITARAFLPKN